MDCLTKQQILDYYRGNKSEAYGAHLADCAACRTELLTIMAEENPECYISPELADKTIDAIVVKDHLHKEKKATSKKYDFSSSASSLIKFAIAAGIVGAVICGLFLVKGPFHDYASIRFKPVSPSVKTGKYGQDSRENNAVSQETAVAQNETYPKKNTVMVFDSVNVRTGKIPVKKDREALIRLGGKTGIAAGPAAVINVKSRTDTTAYIELTKGTALFSIEKNRFREFVVQTPTVRIVVTGTVFSVMADSAYTMVNVVEGTVKLEHKDKSSITVLLRQGDGAFANRDSIINVMIENSQMLKVREKFLRDYIEGALPPPGTGALPGSSGGSHKPVEDSEGAGNTE
jgi:hypothetical protein